jgi:DNA-directed RNA polymerase specialized sigma24 family protein
LQFCAAGPERDAGVQFVFHPDRTLEAMRTRGRFSFFHGVAAPILVYSGALTDGCNTLKMLIESLVYGRSGHCCFSFMTMGESSVQNDDLLAPWLQTLRTLGDEAAEAALARLIEAHIEPVIRGVIRFKLRFDSGARADEADLAQEALAQWLAQVRKLGARPDERSISDARGLAATIAYRICYGWLRRQSPRRRALRNRLQYALTRQAGLALWTDRRNLSIAGFEAWRGRAQASSEKLRRLPEDEKFLALVWRTGAEWQGAKINDLLAAIFDHAGGPVAFDDLVSVVAALLRVKDEPPASTEEEMGGLQIESGEDVAWRVEKRIFLERLWQEVRELPRAQRVALLLNLREADGGGCLALFPATGVASLRQIADALEFPAQQFAELWPRLPLDDATIAGLLELTRQQVINLRKSARERLARRLKGFF